MKISTPFLFSFFLHMQLYFSQNLCYTLIKVGFNPFTVTFRKETDIMFMLLAGGLLIILFAVVVAVVSSVVSAVAAETDNTEM